MNNVSNIGNRSIIHKWRNFFFLFFQNAMRIVWQKKYQLTIDRKKLWLTNLYMMMYCFWLASEASRNNRESSEIVMFWWGMFQPFISIEKSFTPPGEHVTNGGASCEGQIFGRNSFSKTKIVCLYMQGRIA